jgi:hypothetical protein
MVGTYAAVIMLLIRLWALVVRPVAAIITFLQHPEPL